MQTYPLPPGAPSAGGAPGMGAAPGTGAAGASGDTQVMALLLQEAQAQIGKLRAELYGVGRMAEERRYSMSKHTLKVSCLGQLACGVDYGRDVVLVVDLLHVSASLFCLVHVSGPAAGAACMHAVWVVLWPCRCAPLWGPDACTPISHSHCKITNTDQIMIICTRVVCTSCHSCLPMHAAAAPPPCHPRAMHAPPLPCHPTLFAMHLFMQLAPLQLMPLGAPAPPASYSSCPFAPLHRQIL